MVKHIVMYTLKEGVDKSSAIATIAQLLEPLVGQIDGLLKLEVCPAYQGGMDYVLYSELESRAALAAYAKHPLHVAAMEQFIHWIDTRVAGDYEM